MSPQGQRSTRRQRLPLATAGLLALTTAACRDAAPDEDACGGHECDVSTSRDELLAALSGFDDPVAQWLRTAAGPDAAVDGDHMTWLDGLRDHLGCAADARNSYVVLSNENLHPKALVTECSDDPALASRVFAVFEPTGGNDVDPERFRLVGWDPTAQAYHRYQVVPANDGLRVAVEPAFCTTCHGGPFGIDAWTPIMNEMTNPWAQWNAEPGFESFAFEALPTELGDVLGELVTPDRLASASDLEPIIRAAIDRATAARIARRDLSASLVEAADLIRPVFCDESVNYVSEIHDSGEIELSAALDPGLRRVMTLLRPEATWSFTTDETLRIEPPSADEPRLVLVAVRGETTVQAEAALLSRGVLLPIDVARVRALDWRNPQASAARCSLHDAAVAAANDVLVPDDYATTAELARAMFDLALTVPGGSLADAGDDAVVALADAADTAAWDAITSGDFADHVVTVDALGDAIEAALADDATPAGRARLAAERVRRGCAARGTYPTAPLIPGTESCPSTRLSSTEPLP